MGDAPWVVLKYGGTSVATAPNWQVIRRRVDSLLPSARVWVVVSALSTVTNLLLRAVEDAVNPALTARYESCERIVALHRALAADMGLSADEVAHVEALLSDLRRLLDGIVLTGEISPRLRARVAAFGELLSSQLGLAFFRKSGLAAVRVDPRTLLTSEPSDAALSEADSFLEADVRPTVQVARANAAAQGAPVVICGGFIAATPSGATCLLGRGGSDTSAALFASLVGASRLEIWTDVNGMFTADPRFVPAARLIRSLTYREAQELAAMGAKVLHPRCLLPAMLSRIPVEVRNTLDPADGAEITVVSDPAAPPPSAEGLQRAPSPTAVPPSSSLSSGSTSRIIFMSGPGGSFSFDGEGGAAGLKSPRDDPSSRSASPPSEAFSALLQSSIASAVPAIPAPASAAPGAEAKILAVARRKGVTLVTLSTFAMWGSSGFLARVFAPFAAEGVSVDLIATSQYAVSLTLDHIPDGVHGDVFRRVLAALSKICTTSVRYPCAVVSVVGRQLRNALSELGGAMRVLRGVPVHMISEAAEDLNFSFVVDEEHADTLVRDLHASLLESPAMVTDAQFGPKWTDLPCGRSA